jgi:hypothetical protein
VWDIGNVFYDAGKIVKNTAEMLYEGARYGYARVTKNTNLASQSSQGFKQDAGEFGYSTLDFTVDTVASCIPFVPAGSTKLIRYGDDAVDALLNAGKILDKSDLTKAGRALEKHGSRPNSVFPPATGNSFAKNQQGQQILEGILKSKNQVVKPNRFGGKDIFDNNTGRGVRYDADGNMMGFLEP